MIKRKRALLRPSGGQRVEFLERRRLLSTYEPFIAGGAGSLGGTQSGSNSSFAQFPTGVPKIRTDHLQVGVKKALLLQIVFTDEVASTSQAQLDVYAANNLALVM